MKEGNTMPLTYKIDVLDALKQNGYSTYKVRKEKLLGESTLQKLRQGLPVSWENIETICRLLHCQPGDMLEYAEDK
jgi:putative transcriptional regulator